MGVVLLAVFASGCQVWQSQPVTPAHMMAHARTTAFRVTRHDGSRIVVDQLAMQGDTLIGMVRGDGSRGVEMRIPRSDVREVATRQVSVWRTAALLTPVVSYAAMAMLVGIACRNGREC